MLLGAGVLVGSYLLPSVQLLLNCFSLELDFLFKAGSTSVHVFISQASVKQVGKLSLRV